MGGGKYPDGVQTYPATADALASYERARQQLAEFEVPILLSSARPNERLFVAAFDGTGNSRFRDSVKNRTNVAVIYEQIINHAKKEEYRQGFSALEAGYVEGVGTQDGLRGVRDLASGYTYESRMEEMYLQFVTQAQQWLRANPGAEIRLSSIGFSRGAEQAAGFTRLVEERGIRDPEGADIVRGSDGLIERVTYVGSSLRGPGTTIQVIGLFDPVGTGEPREHDRRPAASVVSGFQLTALDERRNLFQGTDYWDPGITEDGRFLKVHGAGAHSDIGGGYEQNGLSIRSGNLMIDYLNALSDRPFLVKRAEPIDPSLNVIHRSEQHQVFYRTSVYDRHGRRAHQDELAPASLCRIDCRDAEPRNEALAASLEWRKVVIGPVPLEGAVARAPEREAVIDRLLDAAGRGDGASIQRLSRQWLDSAAGGAWLEAGRARLPDAALARDPFPVPEPAREPAGWAR